MLYGTLLMGIALYKAGVIWKESAGFTGLNLVIVLVRDQALYFLAYVPVSDKLSTSN